MGHILDRVLAVGREGRSVALAVVTDIQGSAYRRPGARLLIEEEGTSLGGVSGGCLEEDVRLVGREVLRSGRSRTLHYDTGGDETKLWGLGLGCDGEVDVLVQPISPAAGEGPWARVRDLLRGDAPFALATAVAESEGAGFLVVGESGRLLGRLDDPALDAAAGAAASSALAARKSRVEVVGPWRIFSDVLLPPPKLLVCGAGDDAQPTVTFAAAAGFRVSVVDHRRAYLTAQRFPEARLFLLRSDEPSTEIPTDGETYALVKTHSLRHDSGWVKRLFASDVRYLGVLGPRARIDKMLAALGIADSGRIFGPVGLDLGADGPEQVGLSIVAELLAVRAGRPPRHLRERGEAIHAAG